MQSSDAEGNEGTRRESRRTVAGIALGLLALHAGARAQTTERASVGTGGIQGNDESSGPSLSPDGRYVVFHSDATNLVPGDTNGRRDVFLRDRNSGTLEIVSRTSTGGLANFDSSGGAVTPDGRYVAFHSVASNLVAGDTNGVSDVFVRDRQLGTTERVSVGYGGVQGNGSSSDWVSIASNGNVVVFASSASNLVSGDTNATLDVFLRDRQAAVTLRISMGAAGVQGNGASHHPFLSANGRFVAFRSAATNLVAGDTNGVYDVFVRDHQTATTERASVTNWGTQSNGACNNRPSLSGDGRYVAFDSTASNLVIADTNGFSDLFVRDRVGGSTARVSVGYLGQGDGATSFGQISSDGTRFAFQSFATNLVEEGDTNGVEDVFVHYRQVYGTERVSVTASGAQANQSSRYPAVSTDARFVALGSNASNLVAGDTNFSEDVFVRNRLTNDACADALPISGVGTFPFDSTLATTGMEGQGNSNCGYVPSISHDVWFRWTADFSGTAQISTCGLTEIDSKIAVYAGAACPSGAAFACNDNACSEQSSLCVPVTAGGDYLIQAGSYGAGGAGSLAISQSAVADGACAPVDDGTANLAAGSFDATGGANLWLQRFGSIGQSTVVTAISTAWSSPIVPPAQRPAEGSPVQVAIWDDPNDDGNPLDGVLLQIVQGTLVGSGTGAFQTFALDPAVSVSGFFFVGAGVSLGPDQYPIPLDAPGTCSGYGRAWAFGCSGGGCTISFANLAANGGFTNFSDWYPSASQLLLRPTCAGIVPFCVPATGGVLPCPCSNPGQPGKGCNNADATGGALLAVTGNASLASDTLVFTTSGQKASGASVVLQGTAGSSGVVFGQGIRCAAGSLKQLYTKNAAGGSITAPQAGDPSVSARSAALGDPIAPGSTRWYQVHYRDQSVGGGCPNGMTYNLTQGLIVVWM